MKTYQGALDEIRKYGGRWEVLKARCMSAYIDFEAQYMPERSKARAQHIVDGLRKL